MNSIFEMFSYSFMVRALVVGVLLSLSAALVGVPLVLKRNSMLGDGLSHVGFLAFAVASVFGLAPLPVALPIVIIASFLVLRLGENKRIYSDAMIAVMSTSALAIGTFIVSLAGTNVDINNYLFGSVLSIGESEVLAGIILSVMVVLLYIILHNKIFAITFDEKFAKAIGINVGLYSTIFAILCSVVIVLGMRLMGALLISSLIIFPTLSAQIIFRNFRGVVVASAVLAVVVFCFGLMASYLLNTPTGATVVITELLVFSILTISGKIIKQ